MNRDEIDALVSATVVSTHRQSHLKPVAATWSVIPTAINLETGRFHCVIEAHVLNLRSVECYVKKLGSDRFFHESAVSNDITLRIVGHDLLSALRLKPMAWHLRTIERAFQFGHVWAPEIASALLPVIASADHGNEYLEPLRQVFLEHGISYQLEWCLRHYQNPAVPYPHRPIEGARNLVADLAHVQLIRSGRALSDLTADAFRLEVFETIQAAAEAPRVPLADPPNSNSLPLVSPARMREWLLQDHTAFETDLSLPSVAALCHLSKRPFLAPQGPVASLNQYLALNDILRFVGGALQVAPPAEHQPARALPTMKAIAGAIEPHLQSFVREPQFTTERAADRKAPPEPASLIDFVL